MTTTRHERPTGTPIGTGADTMARPIDLTEDQLAIAQQSGAAGGPTTGTTASGQAMPILHPPGTAGATMTASLAGAWQTKRILALYNTRASRTGWTYLDGVGWRRFATTNDSAQMALGMLASAARMSGGSVVAREEADSQLHEIYLW